MGTASYYIDRMDGSERTLIERVQGYDAMYLAFNEFAIRYQHATVNGYTVQVVTAIVDASGKTLKTYDPGEQWLLGSTKSMTDLGPSTHSIKRDCVSTKRMGSAFTSTATSIP